MRLKIENLAQGTSLRPQTGERWGRHLLTHGLAASMAVLMAVTAVASIRMDGSEFQGASLLATAPTTNKKLAGAKSTAASPKHIVATFGQPLMGVGTMTPETSNGVAFKLGLGYEYNVWKTSYDNECICSCAADPACDGVWNVRDVVSVIDVAHRGGPLVKSGNCPYADSDVNCDGVVNAIDAVLLVDVVFRYVPAGNVFCNPCK